MQTTTTTTTTPPRVLRLAEVKRLTGLSKSTIYAKKNERSRQYDEDFPRPIQLTKRSVGWLSDDIEKWLKSLRQRHLPRREDRESPHPK